MGKVLRVAALVLLGLGWLLSSATIGATGAATLEIAAQPLAGLAGTTVTVAGRGATPNAALEIGGGYRQYPEGCAGGIKGGQGNIQIFARTTADGAGNFTATFRVLPGGGEYTYAYFSALYTGTYDG